MCLHGSFSSGKSPVMAILRLILSGNSAARSNHAVSVNRVQRLMNRIGIGRKNWLYIYGSLRAVIRNASLMSLVASESRQSGSCQSSNRQAARSQRVAQEEQGSLEPTRTNPKSALFRERRCTLSIAIRSWV